MGALAPLECQMRARTPHFDQKQWRERLLMSKACLYSNYLHVYNHPK